MAVPSKPPSTNDIVGVILAGGRSRRYGTDKAFVRLAGAPLIDHVIRRAAPQVDRLIISARDATRFAAQALPVVADRVAARDGSGLGPLAGVHAALEWFAAQPNNARWLASFAVDTPLLPMDLVARLRDVAERDGAEVVCARSNGRLHPLMALWSPLLRDDLAESFARGELAAHRFIADHRAVIIDFAVENVDPFINVNTPDELARLASHIEGGARAV